MKFGREDYDRRIIDQELIIPEDEPVFLIRGQDSISEYIVWHWAAVAEQAGVDKEMVAMARKHVRTMARWDKKNTPDLP